MTPPGAGYVEKPNTCTHLDDFILFWFLFYRFFPFFFSIFPMIFPPLFDRFHLQRQEGHNLAVPEAPLLQLFGAENVGNLRCVVECWGFSGWRGV